jgi:hypothetical protein
VNSNNGETVETTEQEGHVTPRSIEDEHPAETDTQSTESSGSIADPMDIPAPDSEVQMSPK